ncbi:zf-HC2 domain-containing protein [Amycolatopsis bartoniae]|uniref:Anti-sigma factor n=1 Tax=Amycolatopsis bartoniae TaxID=941986 RepID=A0A8H9MBW7_9PSEU|nr:zf-HC2 domain-containing protein [Amycolatopsis bartoniae]TVT09646.1 anti-sigma factor [Amycolatopsis bartoniae]GHF38633.1 anti-sigma factor [Amycolatopsis bartoniae]
MSRPSDEFETYDAAYVLGSLSPEDRAAFEAHLKECPECARSVQELAGLPGLLAQVGPEMLEAAEPPSGLMPTVLRSVRKVRRRRTLTTFGVAVAAAAAVVVAVLVPEGGGAPGTAMTPLVAAPVQATAAVAAVSGGSRVDMSCQYKGAAYGADYLLVALRADGSETDLASWWADPDHTAKISLDTAMSPDDILALEIRTASGVPVLRWHP